MDDLDLQLQTQKGDVDLKCRLEWVKHLNKFVNINNMDKIANTKEQLREDFCRACDRYVRALIDQWNIADKGYHHWANDEVGGVFLINEGELAIVMDDIRLCVDYDAPFDAFKNWIEYCLKCDEYGFSTPTFNQFWREECPLYSHEVFARIDELKAKLEDAIEECKRVGPQSHY